MMSFMKLTFICDHFLTYSYILWLCFLIIPISHVKGRGRMIEPPMRSSMWRFYPWDLNENVEKNTDDGGLNCGGFWVGFT